MVFLFLDNYRLKNMILDRVTKRRCSAERLTEPEAYGLTSHDLARVSCPHADSMVGGTSAAVLSRHNFFKFLRIELTP